MKYMFLLAIQGLIVLGLSGVSQGSSESEADGAPPAQSLKNASAIKSKAETLFLLISADDPAAAGTLSKDKSFFDTYSEVQEDCATKESRTTYVCLEKTSPQIAKSLPLIQAAISAMGAGVKDACSSFAKAMDLANKGLLAYQGACATTKMMCQTSCGKAGTNLKVSLSAYLKAANAARTQLGFKYPEIALEERIGKYNIAIRNLRDEAEDDLDSGKERSVVAKNKTCQGYNNQLASAITGGIGVLSSMGKANECDKKTEAAKAALAATEVDCKIPANKANNMTCICLDAPRTPGCPGGLDTALSANSADSMRSGDMAGYTPTAAKSNLAMDSGIGGGLGGNPVDGSSGTSAPGAPVSGGKGVDGGSGLNSGGPGQANGKSGSSLNTNILGGEGGGGGGGGYGYGGSEGSGGGLRQFLPGKRDPAADKLAGSALSVGVTAPSGKSNWEKIRERYRDNNTKLLGN